MIITSWILIFVFVVLMVAVLYSKIKHGTFRRLNIPGPVPAPVFGILPTYKKKGLVWTDLDLVRTYGRIVGIYHGHNPVMLISDPEIIEQICVKRADIFVNRASVMDMGRTLRPAVAITDDAHWKFLRCKIGRIFSSEKIKEITHTIQECSDNLLDSIQESGSNGKPLDFTRICSFYAMDVILRTVFGKKTNSCKCPDEEMVVMALKSWMAGTSGVMFKGMMCAVFPALKHLLKVCDVDILPNDVVSYFSSVTKQCVKERNAKGSDHRDFLKFLMQRETTNNNNNNKGFPNGTSEHRDLTEEEVIANLIFFIMAGYDTTANALGFLGYCLASNDHYQNLLIQEIDQNISTEYFSYDDVMGLPYLDKVVSETLRLYPPFGRFNRRAEKDITINGQNIPRGMDVTIPVFAIHRSEKFWTDPDTFNPERFSPEEIKARPKYCYLPFGLGPRNCLGSTFALLEVKMAAVRILQKFKFRTSSTTEMPPVLQKGGFIKPENGIWLKMESR